MVHWVLNYKEGDVIKIGNKTIKCKRTNRFIATYDPANLDLKIDSRFAMLMKRSQLT